jgi:hypothetical protein
MVAAACGAAAPFTRQPVWAWPSTTRDEDVLHPLPSLTPDERT